MYTVETGIKNYNLLYEFAGRYGFRWHTYQQLIELGKNHPSEFESFISYKNRTAPPTTENSWESKSKNISSKLYDRKIKKSRSVNNG